MKRRVSWFVVTAVVGCLCVWADATVGGSERVTVTDMGKRTVEVPLDPKRIICLSSGTLRLITYLQATDRVVGVEDFEKKIPTGRPYILAHPELKQLPSIGPGGPASINKSPDLEAVLNVRPEVIFISYMEPTNADKLQTTLGIPVVILTHGRFASFDESIYESLRVAGRILKADQRASDVVSYIERNRENLGARTKGVPDAEKPSVYVGAVGYKGVQGIESTDASYTPLEWLGAKNFAKQVSPKDHVFIDKEKLLALNPDIIFIDGGGLNLVKQDFAKKPEFYKGLKAFREKRVYVIYPFNYYVTNISTAMVSAWAIGKLLYPDRFSDVNPRTKGDEIYSFLYGKSLYQQMEDDFGVLGRVAEFAK